MTRSPSGAAGRRGARNRRMAGVSVLELLLVVVLVGILAAFIAPRLQSSRTAALGFHQETLAALRYAHKVAIASGCAVEVQVNVDGVALARAGAPSGCGTDPVLHPAENEPFTTTAPEGVALAGTTFVYDAIGSPSIAQDLVITGPGGRTRTIRVSGETGFAFAP